MKRLEEKTPPCRTTHSCRRRTPRWWCVLPGVAGVFSPSFSVRFTDCFEAGCSLRRPFIDPSRCKPVSQPSPAMPVIHFYLRKQIDLRHMVPLHVATMCSNVPVGCVEFEAVWQEKLLLSCHSDSNKGIQQFIYFLWEKMHSTFSVDNIIET